MMDTIGVIRTNVDSDPEFSSQITVSNLLSAVTRKVPPKTAPYPFPAQAEWTVAYQDTFQNMANSNRCYTAIDNFGSMAAAFGGAYTILPSGNPATGRTWPMRYPIDTNAPPLFPERAADDRSLMTLLTNRNSRNFYYNGHGSANNIGLFVSFDKLTRALKRQPYRFVFLDGCSTANGGLPAAFGINFNTTVDFSFFQKDKTRPRAFLGYDRDILYGEHGNFYDPDTGGNYSVRVRPEVYQFLGNFGFYWYFNYDLASSISNAIYDTPSLPAFWQNGKALKLFGYGGLGIGDYNAKADWQP